MKKNIRKRGQRFIRKFSRASAKASEESRDHIKENLIGRFSHIASIRLLILEWSLMVLALTMLAVAQAFWLGDSYAENTFISGGTYMEATIGDVNSLNPLFATTSSEKTLSRLMFATIVANDYSGHTGIGLADSVTHDESGKVWSVHLREGLKWSDGEPITNEDVIFTAELVKNPAVNTGYDSNLSNVKVSEDENGRVVFELPASYADFDSALNIPVVPKHVLENVDPKTLIEASFSTSPVTSGAFSFNAVQTGAKADEKIYYLSASSNYYKGRPTLSSFAVHTYKDKYGVADAINSSTVTATAELYGADLELVTSNHFDYKQSSLNSGAFIFFNTMSEGASNAGLRAAIREGIDLAKIREAAPETQPLDYPLLKSQITLSNYPELPVHNFESAKTKIAEIAAGQPLHLNVATVNSGYLPGVADAVAEELRALGFEVDVSKYDENQDFVSNVISKRNYDVLVYEVELGADPDLLPYYHSTQASATGLNLSNYRNALVDDLLLGARDSMDEALRIKKYETFLNYWVTGTPAIALYQPNLTYIYNRNVRTYGNGVRLVTALDRFVDIEDWATSKGTKYKTP